MGQDGRMGREMQALDIHGVMLKGAGGGAGCVVREGASSLQQEAGFMALCEGFLACVLGLGAYRVPRK